jgi:hypothetical protein
MRHGAFLFSGKWAPVVQDLAETGMGYTVVTVLLTDGRRFQQAVVEGGYLNRVRGLPDVPFSESDIADIKATHEKWDWAEKP